MNKFVYTINGMCLVLALACVPGCGTPAGSQANLNAVSHGTGPDLANPTRAKIVFVAPDSDNKRTQLLKKAVFKAIEEDAPGTRWHLFFAADHEHVASFTIPDSQGQRRFRDLRTELLKIHAAFDRVDPDADGQVNLPALAGSVRKQLTTETECNIAIYGAPRYLNPDQNAFEHDLVFVTKDGSVGHELSPFQTDIGLPQNCRVVWVTPQTQYGYDEKHMAAIRHFNGFYIQELGGTLLRTTEDLSLLFDFHVAKTMERLVARHDTPGKFPATSKTEWSGAGGIETVEFTDDDLQAPGERLEASPESVLSGAEEDKGTIAIAINWSSADPTCDIDLWLASNGLPGELSFANQTTNWGTHFRDVLSSSSSEINAEDFQNWEWIRVDHARLHDLVLYLNVYRTSAPVRVTVVRVWNGERKVRVVDLNVTKGDSGANRDNRRASNAWHRISLYSIAEAFDPEAI